MAPKRPTVSKTGATKPARSVAQKDGNATEVARLRSRLKAAEKKAEAAQRAKGKTDSHIRRSPCANVPTRGSQQEFDNASYRERG